MLCVSRASQFHPEFVEGVEVMMDFSNLLSNHVQSIELFVEFRERALGNKLKREITNLIDSYATDLPQIYRLATRVDELQVWKIAELPKKVQLDPTEKRVLGNLGVAQQVQEEKLIEFVRRRDSGTLVKLSVLTLGFLLRRERELIWNVVSTNRDGGSFDNEPRHVAKRGLLIAAGLLAIFGDVASIPQKPNVGTFLGSIGAGIGLVTTGTL
jgi:hypothetical protein